MDKISAIIGPRSSADPLQRLAAGLPLGCIALTIEEFGLHEPGMDRRDPHPFCSQFATKCFRECRDRGLWRLDGGIRSLRASSDVANI